MVRLCRRGCCLSQGARGITLITSRNSVDFACSDPRRSSSAGSSFERISLTAAMCLVPSRELGQRTDQAGGPTKGMKAVQGARVGSTYRSL